MTDAGYIVRLPRGYISATTGAYTAEWYINLSFDPDPPGGVCATRTEDASVFASEQEARDAVRALQNRNEARARIERGFNAGVANQLGGAEYLPHADLIAQRDEEEKLREEKIRARLAIAEQSAERQRETVDRIAAELKDAKVLTTPSGEWLRHADEKGIQERTTQDGTKWYRRRTTVDGRTLTSPSFEQLADAVAWEPGDHPAQTAAPTRAAVGVVDPDELGLPQ